MSFLSHLFPSRPHGIMSTFLPKPPWVLNSKPYQLPDLCKSQSIPFHCIPATTNEYTSSSLFWRLLLTHYRCFFAFYVVLAFFALFFAFDRIMTMLRKLPTTATPRRTIITGILIAQTRGRKKSWSGWSSSTNGCFEKRKKKKVYDG